MIRNKLRHAEFISTPHKIFFYAWCILSVGGLKQVQHDAPFNTYPTDFQRLYLVLKWHHQVLLPNPYPDYTMHHHLHRHHQPF